MAIRIHDEEEVRDPEATVRVVQAAFPKGNVYMQMRDLLIEAVQECGAAL